jgi:hypothetical protein
MRAQTRSLAPQPVTPVLQWIFSRNHDAISCELAMQPDRTYRVSVVPQWDAAAAITERVAAPAAALMRHAELASYLRDNGWVLTDYVNRRQASAA